MAAGPRDTPQGRETATDPGTSQASQESHEHPAYPDERGSRESADAMDADEPDDRRRQEHRHSLDEHGGAAERNGSGGLADPDDPVRPLEPLAPLDELEPLGSAEPLPSIEEGQSFRELRPARLLRIWQLAPITALAVGGSLMFAFPLAFESGDAGPVVAMLGLLLCLCAAGWGLMAAVAPARPGPDCPRAAPAGAPTGGTSPDTPW